MTMLNRICGCVLAALWLGVPLAALQPPTGAATDGFVPLDSLPPQEQLPAAPLLVGAYAFVLLMLFGYLVMVSRRLTTIQSEVDRLDADLKRTGKG